VKQAENLRISKELENLKTVL